jgi:hypothetical protein
MNCSSLFYTQNNESNTLHERLKISKTILNKGISKKNELVEFLREELKETFDCEVRFWLQGSYKSTTLIKPADKFSSYDIDIGIYLSFETEEADASEVKLAVKDSLESFCKINDECEPQESKNACEGLKYKQFLTIDTPVYAFSGDDIKLATDKGWIDSDPISIQNYLTNAFEDPNDRAIMKRVVRYLKAWINVKWNRTGYKKIPSLAVNILVADHLTIEDNEDETFINTAIAICESLNQVFRVNSPIDNSNLLSMPDEAATFAFKKLDELKTTCKNCIKSPDYKPLLLANLFEHYFPPLSEGDDSLNSNLPALTNVPSISINRYSKGDKHIETVTTNEITVFKGESLTFSICNKDDFDSESTVYWTVRNIGKQADDANDIGHKTVSDLEGNERRDAVYTGPHAMECMIVNNGSIQGVSSVLVEVKPTKVVPRKKKIFKGFRR